MFREFSSIASNWRSCRWTTSRRARRYAQIPNSRESRVHTACDTIRRGRFVQRSNPRRQEHTAAWDPRKFANESAAQRTRRLFSQFADRGAAREFVKLCRSKRVSRLAHVSAKLAEQKPCFVQCRCGKQVEQSSTRAARFSFVQRHKRRCKEHFSARDEHLRVKAG